ncbi:MAG: KamA family radical SAM protein [Deltaproteobacteria bacterium]|nr:KamA family radical SAM protein [Deltaproteobacteria bacterium]
MISMSKAELVERLWKTEPRVESILREAKHVEEARYVLFDYFDRLRRDIYNLKTDTYYFGLSVVEKRIARECIRVLSNIMRTENENLTDTSPIGLLYDIARGKEGAVEKVKEGFLMECLCMFEGIRGKFRRHVHRNEQPEPKTGREAALERSAQLDQRSSVMETFFRRYRSGLNPRIEKKRKELKKDILGYFKAGEDDWQDYRWHMSHIIKDLKVISSLVKLNEDEIEGLRLATERHIPFEITPHYLSLFNKDGVSEHDVAVRAQVIPSVRYANNVLENWESGKDMDFMGEKSTSPIDGITRRYPQIVIIKPFNSCPQICVYCQRNWEIKDIDQEVALPRSKVNAALDWIRENEHIVEVLVTGGDPLTLDNRYIDWLMGELADMDHVQRIRIGTRTPVTLPMRIDEGLLEVLRKYHEWGRREVVIMTHFEHPIEMTGDNLEAIRRIRSLGINVYNQQVFTFYNSRKFETAFLRKTLKICGVDPYYSFNCMGKEETIDFRVPIARIEQEGKEEARLLPGVVRTDEPVFNVPKLGKSYLRAWQDHEVVMILPDGKRVYRFYSWETGRGAYKDYLYTDVSIYDYIKRLYEHGENPDDYDSIWYYF